MEKTAADVSALARILRGKEYSMVFSDIDGTLLDASHRLTPRTLRALEQLTREAGIPFCLATGRMPAGTIAIMDRLAAAGVPCHRICLSGALVLDRKNCVIASHTLDAPVALEVLDLLARRWPGLCPSYFAGPDWFVTDPGAPAIQREMDVVSATPEQADLRALIAQGRPPNKLFISRCNELAGSGADIARELRCHFPGLQVILSSSHNMIEIIPAGCSKADGARVLLEHLELTGTCTLAFGDDHNDIDLLQSCTTGIALGNAAADVQSTADAVGPSHDEDGVAACLELYLELRRKKQKCPCQPA